MGDDRREGSKTKKRSVDDVRDGDPVSVGSKRSRREDDSPLAMLPVELLYSIHLYAKNPAFTMVSRHLHDIFSYCPTSIKAKYLIARWHEAYCYGFDTNSKGKDAKKLVKAASSLQGASPSTFSLDLLQNGSIKELSWSSRLLPVLPVADWPYPLNISGQRSADHYILDFCLRYPLCSREVLRAVEDIVLSSYEFGNIVLATGLWRKDKNSELCTHDVYYCEGSTDEVRDGKPCHLMINELPKRLFRGFNKTTLEDLAEDCKSEEETGTQIDRELIPHLDAIGAGPYPTSPTLLLLLEVVSLHFAYSLESYTVSSNPVNSFEGLPLAKSTFQKSQFMVRLLLHLGAEPSQTNSVCLNLAIRSGWLEGLQMLVERDQVKSEASSRALNEIRAWHQRDSDRRRYGDTYQSSPRTCDLRIMEDSADQNEKTSREEAKNSPFGGELPRKRRRLADRIYLNTNMLKEAVKHNQWATANWIRSKGVVPDLRTIKLIELKQSKQSGSV